MAKQTRNAAAKVKKGTVSRKNALKRKAKQKPHGMVQLPDGAIKDLETGEISIGGYRI